MKKLQEEIDGILSGYSICGLGVFRNWIIDKAGIRIKDGLGCRFYYDSYNEESDEECTDSEDRSSNKTPSDKEKYYTFKAEYISPDSLAKLLRFFNLNGSKTTKSVTELILPGALVFEKLSEFKKELPDYFNKYPEQQIFYQKHSKETFDRLAIRNILEFIKKIQNHPKINELNKANKVLVGLLEDISANIQIHNYDRKNSDNKFKILVSTHQRLNDWCNSCVLTDTLEPPIIIDSFLEELLKLEKLVSSYLKTEQLQSKLKCLAFLSALENFVSEYAITTSDTDIFEHILMKTAGIDSCEEFFCKFGPHHGSSIINFSIYKAKDWEEEAQQFLKLFTSQGDCYAYISHKDKCDHSGVNWGYSVFADGLEIYYPSPCRIYLEENPIEFNFEVDGEVLADKIFPLFKTHMQELIQKEPEIFKNYQEKSISHFNQMKKEEEAKKLKHNPATFFQPALENGSADSPSDILDNGVPSKACV